MSYNMEILGEARNVKGLIRVLRYGEPPEQCEAAKTLGAAGDKRAIRPLAKALKYGNARLQVVAAEALGTIGGPKTIRPLCKAIKHPDSAVNQAAALALGTTGDPRAIDPLCEAMTGGDRYGLVGVAAKALGMICVPALVAPLSKALGLVGPRLVMVIHTLTETDNEYAFEALTAFSENRPSPICTQWLRDMESRIRGERRGPHRDLNAVTPAYANNVA
jgi:hypothetical protein